MPGLNLLFWWAYGIISIDTAEKVNNNVKEFNTNLTKIAIYAIMLVIKGVNI